MHISIVGGITMFVSQMYEILPEKYYPESSEICPNDALLPKSVFGNAPVFIQRGRYSDISVLHADMDACKGSTDALERQCKDALRP